MAKFMTRIQLRDLVETLDHAIDCQNLTEEQREALLAAHRVMDEWWRAGLAAYRADQAGAKD